MCRGACIRLVAVWLLPASHARTPIPAHFSLMTNWRQQMPHFSLHAHSPPASVCVCAVRVCVCECVCAHARLSFFSSQHLFLYAAGSIPKEKLVIFGVAVQKESKSEMLARERANRASGERFRRLVVLRDIDSCSYPGGQARAKSLRKRRCVNSSHLLCLMLRFKGLCVQVCDGLALC